MPKQIADDRSSCMAGPDVRLSAVSSGPARFDANAQHQQLSLLQRSLPPESRCPVSMSLLIACVASNQASCARSCVTYALASLQGLQSYPKTASRHLSPQFYRVACLGTSLPSVPAIPALPCGLAECNRRHEVQQPKNQQAGIRQRLYQLSVGNFQGAAIRAARLTVFTDTTDFK